jgi:hypothetical protein
VAVTIDFYRQRARECAADADASQLDNVRERYLRSAKAWQDMADRMIFTEALRDKAARDKAED